MDKDGSGACGVCDSDERFDRFFEEVECVDVGVDDEADKREPEEKEDDVSVVVEPVADVPVVLASLLLVSMEIFVKVDVEVVLVEV